jgi:hypothetical protein
MSGWLIVVFLTYDASTICTTLEWAGPLLLTYRLRVHVDSGWNIGVSTAQGMAQR